MEEKIQKELEKAREYCRDLRLLEAYNILRRYYDRLPFKAEPEHAKNIGMFIRILCELGKKSELKFYLATLERLQLKWQAPEIDYQLATIYMCSEPPQFRASMVLLERVIKHPDAGELVAKAKISLAFCYDSANDDVASCRQLIDSVGEVKDPQLKNLLETWKAKILRDEKRYTESESVLNQFFKNITVEDDWYSYFTGKIIQIGLYSAQGNASKAIDLLEEVKTLAQDKPLKTIKMNLEAVEERLKKDSQIGMIQLEKRGSGPVLHYANRSQVLDENASSDKLLLLLLEEGYLDKSAIVRALYERQYENKKDDQLIYYHIHNLRKHLKKVGLPPEAIENDGVGYRLIPEVERLEEL